MLWVQQCSSSRTPGLRFQGDRGTVDKKPVSEMAAWRDSRAMKGREGIGFSGEIWEDLTEPEAFILDPVMSTCLNDPQTGQRAVAA